MNAPDGIKLPPHSIEAERSVLGGLLIDNNAIDRMGELQEDTFYNHAHRKIFAAIQKQASTGRQWDVITVAEMLDKAGKLDEIGGLEYIGHIAQAVPSSANIYRYAEIVREHSMRRQIIAAAADLSEMAYEGTEVQEASDRVQAQLMAITEKVSMDEPKSMAQVLSAYVEVVENRMNDDKKGIPTGLKDLDELLNGGMRPGQVVVLGGRPGMGKTALGMKIAFAAALAEHGALVLSMEMPDEELADRAVAAHGRIDSKRLITAKLHDEDWSRMTHAIGKLHELPMHILDKPGLSFYQVAAYARRHKRKHGLSLLVVDYLQLMTGDPKKERHAQIEEITRGMKVLAKELGIAVLMLSQLSRKTEQSRRPKLSDLRDSGAIEQDADVVLFVYREEVDNPDTEWKGYADIIVAKQRNGKLGRVGATYIGEYLTFEDYTGTIPDWEAGKSRSRF